MTLFFKNRDGQTPLENSMREDLIPTHVQDMTELYELESQNIAEGIIWTQSTHKDHLDYLVWIELHKRMLKDVWRFAGKIREKELSNPDFLMPYEIRPALLQLNRDLKYWLTNKTYPMPELIARFHLQLLTIHPFKDGNGRWSRVLTEFICRKENFEIPSWGISIVDDEQRRITYINAINRARQYDEFQELCNIVFHKTECLE